MKNPTPLKRAVIKEELVALTENLHEALILNQFLYWSERTHDFDKFILEEQERLTHEGKDSTGVELTRGWIYKSGEQMKDEIMASVSGETCRKHMKSLVKKGYLHERKNPRHKWDHTLQYRPDIAKIQSSLQKIGYALEGYPLPSHSPSIPNNSESGPENSESGAKNSPTIPETTIETTTEIKKERKEEEDSPFFNCEKEKNGTTNNTFKDPIDDVLERYLTAYEPEDVIREKVAGLLGLLEIPEHEQDEKWVIPSKEIWTNAQEWGWSIMEVCDVLEKLIEGDEWARENAKSVRGIMYKWRAEALETKQGKVLVIETDKGVARFN